MRKRNERRNSLDRPREWLEHRYDPGYWTDAKIPPLLYSQHPKAGYAFLVSGVRGVLHALVLALIVFRSWPKLTLNDLAALGGASTVGAMLIVTTYHLLVRRRPGYISRLVYIIIGLLSLLAAATVVSFRSLPRLSPQDLEDIGCVLGAGVAFSISLLYLVVGGIRLLHRSSGGVYIFLEAGLMGGVAALSVLAIFSPAKLGDVARFGLISAVFSIGVVALLAGCVNWLTKLLWNQDRRKHKNLQ